MSVVPGSLVKRAGFIPYVWRLCDVADDRTPEAISLSQPRVAKDKLGTTDSQYWPWATLATVVYLASRVGPRSCIVLLPETGLAWVPVDCLTEVRVNL